MDDQPGQNPTPTEAELEVPITGLLVRWNNGDAEAINQLIPLVYRDLHQAARYYLRKESAALTLQPTALLNEVYVNLINREQFHFANRQHFFRASCQLMRRILIDHARAKLSKKRGSGGVHLPLEEALNQDSPSAIDPETLIALHQALKKLEQVDTRKAQVIQLRFFTGLKFEEIAIVLEVSSRTVKRDFETAKHWLSHELKHGNYKDSIDQTDPFEVER